jgi:hypothetical protein
MTVISESASVSYTGDGSTTVFAVPFRFLLSGDLKVYVAGSLVVSGFTVTGAGNPSGGNVTFSVAPVGAAAIKIDRDPPITQLAAYANQDRFPASTHEAALDKLTMISQRHKLRLDGADGRLDGHDTRLDGHDLDIIDHDERLVAQAGRLNTAEGRLDGHDTRLNGAEGRLDSAEGRLGASEGRLDGHDATLSSNAGTLANHEGRLGTIEGITIAPYVESVVNAVEAGIGADPGAQAAIAAAIVDDLQFTQAGTGAVVRPLIARFYDQVSVKDFGAVGDNTTINTAAIQNGIDEVSPTKKRLWAPTGKYAIDGPLTAVQPILFEGDGPSATVIRQTNGSANGFVFDFSDNQLPDGGGLRDMTIECGSGWRSSGQTTSGSTGTGVLVKYAGDTFSLGGVSVNNFDAGLLLNGCWNTRNYNVRVIFFRYIGVGVGLDPLIPTSGGNLLNGFKISNNGYTGPNAESVALQIAKTGGEYWNDVDITSAATGVRIVPDTGDAVLYLFARTVVADTSLFNNWFIDGSSGLVASCEFFDCWGCYSDSSGPGGTAATGTGGAGLAMIGPNVNEIEFVGFRARENAYQGIYLTGSPKNVKFIGGWATKNGQIEDGDNTIPGVKVESGENIQFIGMRAGNYVSVRPNLQAEGFDIDSGVTGSIIGCDVSNPGTGKNGIKNASSGMILTSNTPRAAVGGNTGESLSVTVNSISGVAAGSTRYLTPNGQMAFSGQNPFICSKPGVVEGFTYFTDAAPGAGETYTYTVFKNNSATSMTATSSGGSSFSASTSSNAFTVGKNDHIEVRLVTSGGAAVAIHRGYFSLSP